MKAKRRRPRVKTYEVRDGYTTDKEISLTKLPQGPGPGAKRTPKSSEKK